MFSWSGLKVQAMVDKEKNSIVFAECDADFCDVLFSFMTMPMGTIVSLTDDKNLPSKAIGCMKNLYASVQNLDFKYFRTRECWEMLLRPRNGAPAQCRRLKIKTEDYVGTHCYFYCGGTECWKSSPRMLSHYNVLCQCGSYMNREQSQVATKRKSSEEFSQAGVFLKGLSRLLITDDLKLMHLTNTSSTSLLSDLGVMDASTLELREFCIGKDEVINLLRSSLESKEALTQTLLKKNESPKGNLLRGISCSPFSKILSRLGKVDNGGEYIYVTLFISKSKKIVCFAEAGEDFVDLVFSFLTIPLGHVLKQLHGPAVIDGCVNNLYYSIQDIDIEYFKSRNEKQMLLNPKIPPKFGYEKQLLEIEEVSISDVYLSTDMTVKDPKIPSYKEYKDNGGFMAGPAMFTVTDNLNVIPISPGAGLNILKKLDVPFSDVKECVAYVRRKEAVCLLLASFVSESALTDTFLKTKGIEI